MLLLFSEEGLCLLLPKANLSTWVLDPNLLPPFI